MHDLCNKLKDELPELDILIYDQNSYCNELNGRWNVCFAVGDPEKGYAYTYIIRRCIDFNKTYGCSFINTNDIYGCTDVILVDASPPVKITGLMKQTNSKLFEIIESKLMELMPNAEKVNYFDT